MNLVEGSICTNRVVAALVAGAAMAWLAALQAQTTTPKGPIEKLSATAVSVKPGAGEHLAIDLLRWSTDADREKLVAALGDKADTAALEQALSSGTTLGYIWTSESLGYSLRYAQQLPLGEGRRILVATDRRLGVWTRGDLWKAVGHPGAPDYQFTLLEIHLPKRGPGEGKMSISTPIAVEQATKTIALENYGAAPVLLKEVKTVPLSAYASQ